MIELLLILLFDAVPMATPRHDATACRTVLALAGGCYDAAGPTKCWAIAEYFCSFGSDVSRTGLADVPITWPDEWRSHGPPDGLHEHGPPDLSR